MKHKKRGKRKSRKRTYTKKEMKSPLIITGVVLVLFVVLVIFSILSGPVEKKVVEDELDKVIVPQEIVEKIKQGKVVSPTVRINNAIASKNITICGGDSKCEVSYIFATARIPEDCDELKDNDMAGRCKERL